MSTLVIVDWVFAIVRLFASFFTGDYYVSIVAAIAAAVGILSYLALVYLSKHIEPLLLRLLEHLMKIGTGMLIIGLACGITLSCNQLLIESRDKVVQAPTLLREYFGAEDMKTLVDDTVRALVEEMIGFFDFNSNPVAGINDLSTPRLVVRTVVLALSLPLRFAFQMMQILAPISPRV
jgi:hypothetical protein